MSVSPVSLLLAVGLGIADCVPEPKTVIGRPRPARREIVVTATDGSSVRPDGFTVRTSLAGRWRFRGLDRQAEPFGSLTAAERDLLQPSFDDSGWTTIDVPLNWWEDARFAYQKTHDPREPYFRGFYRHSFTVADPKDGRSRWLRFEEVGAEFDLFVNGRHVAHHLGDFTPVEVEVTDALVAGANLVALRVLADFAPHTGRKYTRVYGANWDHRCVKGGLWHTVELIETPDVRLHELLIDPKDDATSVPVRCRVDNRGGPRTFDVCAALVEDTPGATGAVKVVRRQVRVESGTGELAFDIPAKGARRWSPDDPNLYWAVVSLADGTNGVVTAALDRFGFRTMRIDGGRFRLNGELVYLVGDSLHSVAYGGRREDSLARLRRDILQHKRNGANLLRTAHMPAIPEVYAFADEIGMMIYDEWGNSFCNDIDEEPFEKNNLPELERWVKRDYNHASVVLWSLGNEVRHIRRFDICRQLNLQYDLVRRLDRQGRPASTFSGGADVWAYGTERLKTDFLDTHRYLGIDETGWTTWFKLEEDWYPRLLDVYGESGRLTMPLVMWECVGGGWGLKRDDSLRPGDVGKYLEWAAKPCTWAGSEGIAFTGTVGLRRMLHHHRHDVQRYLADRLCELFVQDRRLAGFAPWFADPQVPGATRWFQPVYPLLRNSSANDGRLMFRQLPSPGVKTVEAVVVNHSSRRIEEATMRVTLVAGASERPLGDVRFAGLAPFDEQVVRLDLKVPAGLAGEGEVRIDLTGVGVRGRNSYAVTLHDAAEGVRPLELQRSVVLAAKSPRTEQLLDQLGVKWRYWAASEKIATSAVLVVPPEGSAANDVTLAAWLAEGGTALVLEPRGLAVPGCPFLTLAESANHHAELVTPAHPAFKGLSQDDFDTWAENPLGAVIRTGVAPLTPGVLAVKGRYIREAPYSGALVEHGVGKGRVVISCFAALEAFGTNPAAAKYLRNLVGYATDRSIQVAHERLSAIDDVVSRPVPTELNAEPLVIVPASKPVRISFGGSSSSQKAPWKIFFFTDRRQQVAEKGYRYLTITFRSEDAGRIDLTIPRQDHGNRLTCTFPTSVSAGSPVTLRLNLRKDFRFAKDGTFGLDEIRGEIILYNGYEARRGERRPPVSFEILNMKFE